MRERELADANAAIEGLKGQVVALKHENASLAKSVQVLSLLALLVPKVQMLTVRADKSVQVLSLLALLVQKYKC
jgi:hypothetical protein